MNADDMKSALIKFDSGSLNCALNSEHEDEKEIATALSMKALGGNNSFSALKLGGFKDYFQFRSLSHLTASSLVWIEDINGESCLFSKTLGTASSQADDNDKVISLLKAWIDNDSIKVNNNSPERQRVAEGSEYECILESESHKGNLENLTHNTVYGGMIPEPYLENTNTLCCNDVTPCSGTGEKASFLEVGEQKKVQQTETESLHTNEARMDGLHQEEKTVGGSEELVCSPHGDQDCENSSMSKDCKDDYARKNSVRCNSVNTDAEVNLTTSTRKSIFFDLNLLPESPANLEAIQKDTDPTVQVASVKSNKGNDVGSLIQQKYDNKDKRSVSMKQKIKPNCEQIMHTSRRENKKENKEKASAIFVKVSVMVLV